MQLGVFWQVFWQSTGRRLETGAPVEVNMGHLRQAVSVLAAGSWLTSPNTSSRL